MRAVRVQDVVLDESHFHFDGEDSIGTILYTEINDSTPYNNEFKNLKPAKPVFYNMDYPTANEIVFVCLAPSLSHNNYGNNIEYYFPPIAIHKSPTSNALPNAVTDKGDFFQGSYFKENINIRPLRPYEGDVLVEGRWGNSIRFGSTVDNQKTLFPNYWSNMGEKGNPITIIRNGQNPGTQSPQDENPRLPYIHIIEDIQNDDATIALCSNQQITHFRPASFNMGSYGASLKENQKNKEEVERNHDELSPDTTEDLPLTDTNVLPASELRAIEESTLPPTSNNDVYFDIAPTGDTPVFPTTNALPTGAVTSSTADINQTLGSPDLAPNVSPIDNT